jgi:hypothetical protein
MIKYQLNITLYEKISLYSIKTNATVKFTDANTKHRGYGYGV